MNDFNSATQKTSTLSITDVDWHGQGLSHQKGETYIVPLALPGETVVVSLGKKTKNGTICKLVTILESSPNRITPQCPLFEDCGGCDWQHMDDFLQATIKEQNLKKLFQSFENVKIQPFKKASKTWRYRNRITLHKDKNHIGFFAKKSHTIIPVDDCLIAESALIEKMKTISSDAFGKNDHFEIRQDDAASFIQVNREQNEILKKLVVEALPQQKSQSLLELYAGAGNLTSAIAKKIKSIIAVESHPDAVERGRKIAKELGLKIKFVLSEAHDYLFECAHDLKRFDTIVCDPPRTGLQNAASLVAKACKSKLIYVSCDPHTFVRDAKILEKDGLKLKTVTGIDMFPQTHHIELVATFDRI